MIEIIDVASIIITINIQPVVELLTPILGYDNHSSNGMNGIIVVITCII